MKKKRIVIALGHEALGSTLPEQQKAAARTAKAVADFIREDYQVVITHSNGPQVGMIDSYFGMFGNEPGIYRLRSAECNPYRVIKPWNLQDRIYGSDTGNCGSL